MDNKRLAKSMCCNADKMYLGRGNGPISVFLNGLYLTCCVKCGRIEWSTDKEKVKYKWYKHKNLLKELQKKGNW